MAKNLLTLAKTFIEKYYYNELLECIKKGESALLIDFSKLIQFDLELADKLLAEPSEILEHLEAALKEFEVSETKIALRARIANLPKSQNIKISDIRSKHLGKFIATEGLIRQASEVRPKITVATFECTCGAQIVIEQRDSRLIEPSKCQCGRKAKFRLIDKKLIDIQRLVVEESPETLSGAEQAKRINVFLSEDLLDPKLEKKRYPGNKVCIVGIVKEVEIPLKTGGRSTKYDLLIDANSINTIEEEFEEIVLTKDDKEKIEALAADPKIYDKLVSSVAPSIYGYNEMKEAIVLQLFGAAKKERKDGTRMRGDIHIFLCGDPGSGKSELLRYISTLAPRARYVSGKGATSAGLTAAVVKDEFMRGWALEAGALVLANKGIACIDELDKMTPEDQSAMHEALEQQRVTISKANIQATLRAETAVLAAANPKFGRFDSYKSIGEQIDMPSTLLNRFDLIFAVRDIPNPKVDQEIAKHVLEMQRDVEVFKPEVPSELLRKYIAFAKQTCFPKLTASAEEEIRNFYVSLRETAAAEGEEIRRIPISARQLQALIRLAEASARIRLSDKIMRKDAQRAIDLLKSCMKAVGTDPETGKFDIDRITTGITATQRSRIAIVQKVIEELEAKLGKNIPVNEILNSCDAEGLEKARVEETLSNLIKSGDLFEPKPGLVQRVK